MAVKAFELSEKNQPIWNEFARVRMAEIVEAQERRGKINELSAKVNLATYKEAAILLDSLCNDFSKLTLKIVDKARNTKRENHINGFLLSCRKLGLLSLPKDIAISILPAEYRCLFE